MQKKEEIYTDQDQLKDLLKSYDDFIVLMVDIIEKIPHLTQKAVILRARLNRLKNPNTQQAYIKSKNGRK